MKNQYITRNIDIISLIGTYFLLNLIILPYMFKEKYSFLESSLPYFLDPDSFYYLTWTNVYFAYFITIILSISIIILFYLICSKISNYPFSISLALITFPYFFKQIYLPNFDMQKFLLFSFVMILLGVVLRKSHRKASFLLIFLPLICITFVWSGYPVFFGLFLFTLIYSLTKGVGTLLGMMIGLVIGIIFFQDNFISLIMLKGLLVSEYITPTYFLYYFLFVFVTYWYFFLYKTKDFEGRFFFSGSLFMFILSLFIGRFSLFAVVLILLLIAKMRILNSKVWRIILVIFIIFNVIVMVSQYRNTTPRINIADEMMLRYCFDYDYPVLSFWDTGYYVEYFSGNKAVFKANPIPPNTDYYNLALATQNLTILDNLTQKPYYLYIMALDSDKLEWYGYNASLNKNTLKSAYMDGFKTICNNSQGLILLRR